MEATLNLRGMNMQELSTQELLEVDGGVNWWMVAAGAFVVTASFAVSVAFPVSAPIALTVARAGAGLFATGFYETGHAY